MIKVKNIEYIATYEIDGLFILEISKDTEKKIIEFWLYKKGYGVKDYIIGLPGETLTDEMLEIINNTIYGDIDFYIKKYA